MGKLGGGPPGLAIGVRQYRQKLFTGPIVPASPGYAGWRPVRCLCAPVLDSPTHAHTIIELFLKWSIIQQQEKVQLPADCGSNRAIPFFRQVKSGDVG